MTSAQQEQHPPTVSSNDPGSSTGSPRYRPYASPEHRVVRGRYITSNDPRGFIPVYEYPLHGQWIMMDSDDGYVLWTGIWKALGHNKADIVRMLEAQPDLAPVVRRIRGGYLKIQGTWLPYEIALKLSRRVAWPIRHDLIPLFGPTFPDTCLSPGQPGFGQVLPSIATRRRRRTQPPPAAFGAPVSHSPPVAPHLFSNPAYFSGHAASAAPAGRARSASDASSHSYGGGRVALSAEGRDLRRHAPYPPSAIMGRAPSPGDAEAIVLAPFRPPVDATSHHSGVTLPSLSALEQGSQRSRSAGEDPLRVLARLKLDDKDALKDKIRPCCAQRAPFASLPRLPDASWSTRSPVFASSNSSSSGASTPARSPMTPHSTLDARLPGLAEVGHAGKFKLAPPPPWMPDPQES